VARTKARMVSTPTLSDPAAWALAANLQLCSSASVSGQFPVTCGGLRLS
jgi:hypothetical protein